MSIEEIISLGAMPPPTSDEVKLDKRGSSLHNHIPLITSDHCPPISTRRIITDFGKVLFAPANIPGIIATTTLTTIEMAISFLSPYLLGKLVQNLTSQERCIQVAGQEMSRTALMILLVGSSVLSQILPTLRSQVMVSLYANIMHTILMNSTEHLLGKSLDYHVQTPINAMFNLMQKGFAIQNFGLPLLTQIIPTIVEIGVACIFLSQTYDTAIGISLVCLVASYIFYGIFTTSSILESREKAMNTFNVTFETIGKVLSRYKIMRDCNQLNRDLQEVSDVLHTLRQVEIESSSKPLQVSFGHSLMSYIHMLFAVLSMGKGISSGHYQTQDLILLFGYLGRLASSLPSFGSAINQVLSSYPDLKFVFSELAKPDEVVDPHPDIPLHISDKDPPTIEFDHVTFCYPTKKETPIFQELSLKIPGGKKVAIVSESGSGKTTLFNLLYGYYTPAAGTVKINGQDITQVSLNSLQKQICLLGQNPNLFQGTIRDNILYGSAHPEEMTDDQIFSLAQSVGLGDFFDSFPDKLDTQVGEGGKALSGGQQQKISLLRSFLGAGSIFLLDEATASLDVQSAIRILEKLFTTSRKVTALMITHKLTEAQMADETIVLGEGKVLGQGTHIELLRECSLYRNLWEAFQAQQNPLKP